MNRWFEESKDIFMSNVKSFTGMFVFMSVVATLYALVDGKEVYGSKLNLTALYLGKGIIIGIVACLIASVLDAAVKVKKEKKHGNDHRN